MHNTNGNENENLALSFQMYDSEAYDEPPENRNDNPNKDNFDYEEDDDFTVRDNTARFLSEKFIFDW